MMDIVVCMVMNTNIIVGSALRPFIIILFYQSQQDFARMVLHNIKDSAVMLTCILMFILYCAFIGRFFFRSSFEGEAYFLTTLDSYWTMFQTLTTENYPDVFLLGYAENSLSALFFVLFTMVAVFFLLNVLLAVIFDNYKNRLERVQRSRQSQRLAAIEKFFDAYDTDKSGYLSLKQSKLFFTAVLDLNFGKRKHRQMFIKIMKIVDPEKNRIVFRERIMEFFLLSGF